jgi:hypothetical protein
VQTRIQKWGNSLGLRIPRSFAAEAQVEEGATVDLSVENGRLLVRPLRVRKYALSPPSAGVGVEGAILSDQLKSLDWRVRKARRIGNVPAHVLRETVGKILALVYTDGPR